MDKQKNVSIGKLMTHQMKTDKAKVTTMTMHNLETDDKLKLEKYNEAKSGEL